MFNYCVFVAAFFFFFFLTYWSLVGSLKSFQPSGAIMSAIIVLTKTTREKGLHARPNHTLPVPPIKQLTNANPVLSSLEVLPCAVMAPFTFLDSGGSGFAMEINWQFCVKQFMQQFHHKHFRHIMTLTIISHIAF